MLERVFKMTSFNIHTCLKPGEQTTEKCFKLLSRIWRYCPYVNGSSIAFTFLRRDG